MKKILILIIQCNMPLVLCTKKASDVIIQNYKAEKYSLFKFGAKFSALNLSNFNAENNNAAHIIDMSGSATVNLGVNVLWQQLKKVQI